MRTYATVLAERLRSDPGQPLITFYDGASGERVELSVTTYANWVAKASALLIDELDLERGQSLRVDLPPHWLAPVFLGAAWNAGLVVTGRADPDVVVCGPETLGAWAGRASGTVVLASSLLPLGVRFAEPVPPGVHDVGLEIWGQPDGWTAWDPPDVDDVAHDLLGTPVTHGELWAAAGEGPSVADGGRLLSAANPATASGLGSFTVPLARGGSLVMVLAADAARVEQIYAAERADARFSG